MSDNYPFMDKPQEPKTPAWEGGCLWTGIGVIFGGLTLGLLFVIVSLTRLSRVEQTQHPVVTVIVPPTHMPFPHTPSPDSGNVDDNATTTPDLGVSEVFAEGDLVEIYGTEGQGLSLRKSAGLSSEVAEYGLESEVFEVFGGPIEADGYTWWYLVNPYDNSKQGWGVGRYLQKISP